MAYEVEAFGKIIEVPDDIPKQEAYKQIMANRHKLDPDYVPEKPSIGSKLNDLAAEYLAVDKSTIAKAFTPTSSIADQAEASANEGENAAAPQVPGAPVRQSAYNRALLDPNFGVRPTERFRKPNVNGVLDRTRVAANENIKGQANQQELELLRTEALKPSESGFTASALNSAGRTIKGAGQIGSDFFDANKDNAITQYGQKLLDNNPLWVKKLEDIKDEPFLAFKEASGNSVPSMGAMVGVGALGAGIASLAPLTGPAAPVVAAVGTVVQWLGPAAVAALPSYSGIRDAQILKDPRNEADAKSKAIAAIGASAVGAIEVAFGPQQWAIAMLTKEGRAAMARKFASTSTGEAAIKGAALGAVQEGSEEIVQNPIEQLASYEDPTTKKNLLDTAFGGAMGALGGSFPGAVTGAASQVAQQANIDRLKPIADAPTVDDAITAAHAATTGTPDVLRTVDPTLADIEALTGVKPNETQTTIATGQAQAAEVLDIVLPDNSSVKAQWKIVDADQLAASMKEDVNQPRDRTRAASDVQIKSIANAPDYRRLSDSPVMDIGAPVVDQDGRIVAGNGRFAGLSQAYEQGTATEYLNQLREDAARKGLSIEGINKPVLVRQLSEPVDTRKLAIASNSGTTLQMSALEQAKLDAERMKGIENLEVNDLGDIALTPRNLTQLKDSLGTYAGTELGAMVDKAGQLSQEGMRRVRNAMLAKAYGSSPVLEKLVESTDSDMRNVLGALTKSANHIISTKGDVKPLMEAVDTYSQLKATGQPVDNFLAQQDAFSEGLSKEAEGILRFIDTNVRSQKKLTDFFKGNFVEVDTTSADMFNQEAPKDERITSLEKHLNDNGYDFTVEPASVRDIDALDSTKKARKELAEKQAKFFKKKVVFVKADGPFSINGVMVPSIADTIFVDIRTTKPFDAIMAHELSHWMEQEKHAVYKQMVKSLKQVIKDDATGKYAKKYGIDGATKADLTKEIVGDIMGDNFTEQSFWDKVAAANPEAFKDIAAAIIKWLKGVIVKAKANGMGSEEWVKDAAKAQDIVAKAVAQYTESEVVPVSAESKPKFHKAFHGSPHDHNKFDTSKIGTGEGAQAYGFGHYFAESRDVAEYYKKTLSNDDNYATSDGTVWSPNTLKNLNARVKVRDALRKNTDLTKPIAQVQEMLDRNESEKMREMLRIDLSNLHDIQERGGLKNTLGKLYEVELAPEQDEYLLWDKPLSEQSDKVKAALGEIDFPITFKDSYKAIRDVGSDPFNPKTVNISNGNELYSELAKKVGGSKRAADYLHSLGIRGIKYLDGLSRGKGEGAYNYVIFDDKDVSITAKFSKAEKDYRMDHQSPGREGNAPLSDLTGDGNIYPDDVYSSKAVQYYGTGDDAMDKQSFAKARSYRGKPNSVVEIYRAVPKGVADTINPGDWVTINRNYAKEHGESYFDGNYDILSKKVKAGDIFTNGDSIHEWGYEPEDNVKFSRAPKLYSKLEQALEAANDKVFSTGPQVKLWLQSNAGKMGIKKDEIYWSGIDNWLDAQGKVSKQQVVEFVRSNGVKVEDVTSSGDAQLPKHNYSQLNLPGGTDYKELVVTVPTINPYNADDSPHFGDAGQGKQIGWIRMDTRNGGLFIEELQSQRSQGGRKMGFNTVPPAPFISTASNKPATSYITLLMKKALIEAVSNDHASVSWTTGDQQAERYDLKTGSEWAQSMYGNEQGLNLQGKPSLISQAANDIFKHVGSGKVESINGQPGFYITPEMKSKDLPLFSKAIAQDGEYLNAVRSGDMDRAQRMVNDKLAIMGAYWHGTPSGDLRGGVTGLHVGTKQAAIEALEARIGIPADGRGWDGTREYGKTLLAGRDRVASGQFGKYRNTGYNADSPKEDFYAKDHKLPTVGGGVKVDPSWKPWIRPVLIVGNMAKRKKTDSAANSSMYKLLSKGEATEGFYYNNIGEDAGSVSAVLPNGDYVKVKLPDTVTYDDAGEVIPLSKRFDKSNNDIRFSKKPTPPEETRFRKFQRMNQDSFNRFTVIKEWLAENGQTLSDKADVYGAEERYHSMAANQLEDFREQQRNPLIEKIQKAGYTLGDIEVFLKMQHAQEANAQIRKLGDNPDATAYGIDDQEAADYLAEAPENLAKLANEFRAITEQTKKLRVDAGVLSQEESDAYDATYKHYIPVKGDADATRGAGRGLTVNFKSKRRLGHSLRDEHVIENILMDRERAILQVERNRVWKHVGMMAAEMQRPDILSIGQPEKRKVLKTDTAYTVEVNGVVNGVFKSRDEAKMFKQLYATSMPNVAPSAIVIYQTKDQRVISSASPMLAENESIMYMNGHAVRIQVKDELMARALLRLGVEQFSDIVGAGRILNGYLSKVYTGYNPEFILTNMIRDFSSGTINLTGEQGIGMATKALTNYPRMFTDLLKYAATNGKSSTKWIDAYRKNGGNTGAAYLSDMERLGNEVNTEYASYQGVLSNLKQGDNANAARAAGRKVFNATLKWIYNLNQAGENAMRLAAFKAMIDSGRTVNEAAKVAKNITVNFNRKGERQWTPALYLFYNASVQSTAAAAHALAKGEHRGQAWALASGMAAVGYMMFASLGGGTDDDWDEINDYTKERNMLIKSGDGYVKVPIPYGYGFFYNLGGAIAEAQRTGEWGKIPWHLATSAISEFTPFNDVVVGSDEEFRSDQVFMGFLPTAMKIVAQPVFNKQLFTGSELMPESQFDKSQPDRQKMFRGTKGTMYDEVAGWLDAAGMDVSPETLKYITRTGTGGAGSLVDTTISAAMLKSEGAELDTQEIPFVRKGYMELGIKDKRAAYYKVREEARTAAEEFNRARRDNDVGKMQDVLKDKKELIALDRYANKLAATIDAARDQQDAVRADKKLSVQEKRLKLKDMEATEAKFYDQYLDVFKAQTHRKQ